MPPGVSVHQGDWKLIRIFHGSLDGKQHRWMLYNLREDVGEQNNLADEHPERVAQMDALIETFLVDTNAVQPIPNPRFDPAKFDLSLEGKAKLKGIPKAKKPNGKGPNAKGARKKRKKATT